MIKTIYALASAHGRAGIAVIRVSGPQALHSFESLTGLNSPERRKAHYCTFKKPMGDVIDKGVAIFFESPSSYTGEDVAEYQIHGSQAVLNEFLDTLSKQPNHRMAEPGEFTRRAFENGKMDLTEAEAVADLINAQTALQKSQALKQLDGSLKDLYESWSEDLKKSLAYIEADLEFPDEDDADGVTREVVPVLDKLIDQLKNHLNDNRRGELLRDGIQIVIIGAPNAGKSSLLNALAKRDVAIVSDIAGTTRDVIEVSLDIMGYPVILSDTAGLRPDQLGESDNDVIEAEGIRRALQKAENADVKVLLYDGGKKDPDPYTLSMIDENVIKVVSKADQKIIFEYPAPLIEISSKTGQGLDILLKTIQDKIIKIVGQGREAPSLTRMRHRKTLHECLIALKRSKKAALPELMAEDVRLAIRSIGQITGRIDVEDLLDVIFRDFCIGK